MWQGPAAWPTGIGSSFWGQTCTEPSRSIDIRTDNSAEWQSQYPCTTQATRREPTVAQSVGRCNHGTNAQSEDSRWQESTKWTMPPQTTKSLGIRGISQQLSLHPCDHDIQQSIHPSSSAFTGISIRQPVAFHYLPSTEVLSYILPRWRRFAVMLMPPLCCSSKTLLDVRAAWARLMVCLQFRTAAVFHPALRNIVTL